MEYNYTKIGERIKELRKEKGWNQATLIEKLSCKTAIGRNTLSAIENGNAKHFELTLLTAMCELFNCNIGYLLCEYDDCKTYDNQLVHDYTGLSQDTIFNLREIASVPESASKAMYDFLEALTDSIFFPLLAIRYKQYVDASFSSSNSYHIIDNNGETLDIIDGDIATILLQNAFNHFLASPQEYSRSSLRNDLQNLTTDELEGFLKSAESDILRGK